MALLFRSTLFISFISNIETLYLFKFNLKISIFNSTFWFKGKLLNKRLKRLHLNGHMAYSSTFCFIWTVTYYCVAIVQCNVISLVLFFFTVPLTVFFWIYLLLSFESKINNIFQHLIHLCLIFLTSTWARMIHGTECSVTVYLYEIIQIHGLNSC